MIDAIGEASMQQTVRASYSRAAHEKELVVQKTDQIRKNRPVENTEESPESRMNMREQENTTTKNILEDGKLVVEKYDKDGKLIRKIPPGYVPFANMV
ncbi:MAG: hypothetical protein JSW39_13880 [Desulfobacterales bacterium]|nr:MAG: hypothetical protein JSW39_13880 [Desulfobacterales bacterium]